MRALALDDPKAKYLPWDLIRGIHVLDGKDCSGEITIRDLLLHRSGIADYYDQKAGAEQCGIAPCFGLSQPGFA